MFYNTETGKTQTNVCLPRSPRWNWTNEVDMLGIPRTGSLSWPDSKFHEAALPRVITLLGVNPKVLKSAPKASHDVSMTPSTLSPVALWTHELPLCPLLLCPTMQPLSCPGNGQEHSQLRPFVPLPRMFFPHVSMWLTSLSLLSLLKCHTFPGILSFATILNCKLPLLSHPPPGSFYST